MIRKLIPLLLILVLSREKVWFDRKNANPLKASEIEASQQSDIARLGQPRYRLFMLKKIAPETWTALLFAFVLTCIKKWEVGGNLDTIWYSAIGRSISQNGDWFHFYVSEKMPEIRDHMPLTYWITGGMMKLFGTTDFVARLYPMASSILSIMIVYTLGRRYKDNISGLIAVLVYALCIGSTKWNGALLHDVPLTTFFLLSALGLIKGRDGEKRYYFLMGTALFLALMTKGPIIGGFGLGYLAYAIITRETRVLGDKYFWFGIATFGALVAFMFLPQLSFDGDNVFLYFYKLKSGYLAAAPPTWANRLAYVGVLWESAFFAIILIAVGLIQKAKPWTEQATTRKEPIFYAAIVLCTMVPLSYFQTKFPHYMLPCYPFAALAASPVLERAIRKYRSKIPAILKTVSCAVIMFFVLFPIKTTGNREKHEVNLANFVKLIGGNKTVHYVGRYEDDYALLQTFKFYGNIDLQPISREDAEKLNLSDGPVLIRREKLPLKTTSGNMNEAACVFLSKAYCVLDDRTSVQIHIPNDGLPHELMSPTQLQNLDEVP